MSVPRRFISSRLSANKIVLQASMMVDESLPLCGTRQLSSLHQREAFLSSLAIPS